MARNEIERRFRQNPVRPTAQINRFAQRGRGQSFTAPRVYSTGKKADGQGLITRESNPNMGWKTRLALNKQIMAGQQAEKDRAARMAELKLTGAQDMAKTRLSGENQLATARQYGENTQANTRLQAALKQEGQDIDYKRRQAERAEDRADVLSDREELYKRQDELYSRGRTDTIADEERREGRADERLLRQQRQQAYLAGVDPGEINQIGGMQGRTDYTKLSPYEKDRKQYQIGTYTDKDENVIPYKFNTYTGKYEELGIGGAEKPPPPATGGSTDQFYADLGGGGMATPDVGTNVTGQALVNQPPPEVPQVVQPYTAPPVQQPTRPAGPLTQSGAFHIPEPDNYQASTQQWSQGLPGKIKKLLWPDGAIGHRYPENYDY